MKNTDNFGLIVKKESFFSKIYKINKNRIKK